MSTIADKTAQENPNPLRKFALSLLKRYKAETNTKQPIFAHNAGLSS